MSELVPLARQLRRTQTDAERILWGYLRAGRLEGMKFRRQVPIGRYIVDFVTFDAKLIVELDGGQHNEERGAAADTERTEWLVSQSFQVLRFWNFDVTENIEAVIGAIRKALHLPGGASDSGLSIPATPAGTVRQVPETSQNAGSATKKLMAPNVYPHLSSLPSLRGSGQAPAKGK